MQPCRITWTVPAYQFIALIDEFGNLTLPGFTAIANTIRGYRVSLSIILQSMAQLPARYGRDYAQSIQGGFNTYLAYSGADQETARFFEAISGKVIEVRKDKIEDVTQQRHEYNLLNADAVRRISESDALVVSANKNPAIIAAAPYFQHRKLSRIPKRYGVAHLGSAQNPSPIKRVPIS